MTDFFFKSELFTIEPGEDEETNPQCYGKQLSTWLKEKLEELSYPVEDVIAEDWGWCVMCQRVPYNLWVGCGCRIEREKENPQKPNPPRDQITWHCFVVAEVPFLKKLFRKVDTSDGIKKLARDLESILASEPRITLVSEP